MAKLKNRRGCFENQALVRGAIAAVLVFSWIVNVNNAPAQDFSGSRSAAASAPGKPRNCRFRQLRFSPDGRYILAQQANSVALLAAQPFHLLFQRSAENVSNAGFSPDSQQIWLVSAPSHVVTPEITFAGSAHYVERWSIAGGARIEMKETHQRSCESSTLSPDGRILACVGTRGKLRLVDVGSGEILFERIQFGTWGDRGAADLNFSPDGRYLLAVPRHADGYTLAWDLTAKAEVKMKGRLRKREPGDHFAFVAPDRVLISSIRWGTASVDAALFEFPSGKRSSKAKVPPGQLFQAADPAFVLIRPRGRIAPESQPAPGFAAVEYRTGKIIPSDAEALDVFGNHFVMELPGGKLGFCERGKGILATAAIE